VTTEVDGRARRAASVSTTLPLPSLPPGEYRPARPAYGPGRWFRACAGVREDVMDWTPGDRLKYAGLGIIVLNTGCLAAFAMFTALHTVLSAPSIALLPLALVWGWMIFSADRWLITSTHGVFGRNRVLVFIPRLILAVLLAFTIAEPLTLRIFQNTLDSTVATDRTSELQAYESALQTCNPVSGNWITSVSCQGDHLTVAGSPYAAQQKLATAKQQLAQETSTVGGEVGQELSLTKAAQDECAGTSGVGLSGLAGDGPLCHADRTAAANYAQENGIAAKQAQLDRLQTSVATMIQQAGSAQATYAANLHVSITEAVQKKQQDIDSQIGIIDEWSALEQLSSQSAFVFFGHWLLVLVLMALDCLPVLAKMMSGSSAYDKLLAEQRATDERVYALDLKFREEALSVDKEIGIYSFQSKKRSKMREFDRKERVQNAQGANDGLDGVRALAQQWIEADGDDA
jgi:hypothetical protein